MPTRPPNYPLYIVSKGRAESRYTSRTLERMQVPYRIVIEEQEFSDYVAVIDRSKILVLDKQYQRDYDTFDDLGDSKSKGPGPARNFVWDHAIDAGFDWHWVMDDNIRHFFRFNNNSLVRVRTGAIFTAMEDFVLRYTNIGMAGPQYYMFVPRRYGYRLPPFVVNTRIYSCNFIRNELPFRWRGRYNEDTDLSLRILKARWATVQFNAFLQEKLATQLIKGGNTKEFYDKEGTRAKSEMQVAMHPDVSRIVWRFGRIHHHVNYRPFKCIKLQRSESASAALYESNEYGMTIQRRQ